MPLDLASLISQFTEGGGGGAPPSAPGGMGAMGGGEGPSGNPMAQMTDLQSKMAPGGEDEVLGEASKQIGIALSRVFQRSPKASRLLTEALSKIQSAREALKAEGTSAIAAPPNLGAGGPPGMSPSPMGGGGMPGMF